MSPLLQRFVPFLTWRDRLTPANLRADALAGLIAALVVLPQAVAYATLAGLPPQFGLYCAMLPVIVAALWGSSWHQISGPTNALSLVVFATVAPFAAAGSPEYIGLVLTLCLLVGAIQLAMGLARLGMLVNFISHTVVIAFTAGAGLLIIASQLRNFLGIPVPPGASFFGTLHHSAQQWRSVDPAIATVAAVTLVVALVARSMLRRFPYMIVAMVAGSVFAWALARSGGASVPTVGPLPSGLPALSLPSFDPEVWRQLAPAALALTVLGLTEAVSIARAIAVRSGQRIDGNQEFIGQGLSNLVGAFSSSYPSSGSFNRSGINYEAGAQTPLSAVFSAAFLFVVLLAVAPLAAYLPLAVMAALLVVVAIGLVDVREMRRIARASRGDALVLLVTFAATLTLQLEFAIFVGVLVSLLVYLKRTTHPRLTRIPPESAELRRRYEALEREGEQRMPVDVLRVDGSLFFGAVDHVRDELEAARRERPGARHRLLVASGINFIDYAGAELLARTAAEEREAGSLLWLAVVKAPVLEVLAQGGFLQAIGEDRVYETRDQALRAIFARLDETQAQAPVAAAVGAGTG